MNDQDSYLEQIWDGILSREEARIRSAFHMLDQSSREVVFQHLQKMSREDGWHPEQVNSARIALDVIHKIMSE
ncbi:MAG TPA: hypothetical protein PKK59_05205 [Anaerolineaceae bacterium]|nr:hypothetical protein [Anaerolineaceae bacterium]